jgi:2-methylisocitrate lyase-like PEP mutase family enzyme
LLHLERRSPDPAHWDDGFETRRVGDRRSAVHSSAGFPITHRKITLSKRGFGFKNLAHTSILTMTMTQNEKARRFQELHRKPGVFLIPNPWDAGSARLLAGLGYEAFATSSAAAAGVLGRRDGRMTREESLANARIIVEATELPVAADLEHGFGDSPAAAAETISLAASIGLVGGSIEDARADRDKPIYDLTLATERVAAAVLAARSLPFPFTLAARAENYVRGNSNLDDTIKRLVAYEKAGADVLFAPGLPDLAAVRAVCSAVSKPVNFAVGGRGRSFSVAELAAAGVKRISFAATFYRASLTGLMDAAQEAREKGTFSFVDRAMLTPELNLYFPE